MKSREGGVVVRYRLTVAQMTLPAFAGGLLGIGAGMFGDWRSGHLVWHASMWGELAGLLWMCVVLAVLTRVRPAAVTLTPHGVTARGWRTRVIGWPDITSVTVVSDFPGFRLVVLTTTSGKRIRLPAPLSFLDLRFTEKVETIRAHWTPLSGDDACLAEGR
jgi:hypothetical protein